ncbi:MAG: Uma2 family endonuclease [Desulfobacterales bacterium]|nr:Uma2 family endonuclease [Desulfobacterales bacterium]
MTQLTPLEKTVSGQEIILLGTGEKALQELSRAEHESREEFPLSEDGLAVSEDEYWEKYYEHPDFSYEWNNGYLEERPVSDYEGYLMYDWFDKTLKDFLTVYPIAKKVGLEFGFRMALPHKTAIRKPDLGVLLNHNPAGLHLKDRTYSGTFDLCIEAMSDSTLKAKQRDTVVKKGEYESAGVTEYYILDPNKAETAFYRRNMHGIYEHIRPVRGDIIQSGVLPGFQFRISDLYKHPLPEQMAEDSVYQAFVMLSYQAEKQRAEQERQRAEQEKQRAEQAENQLVLERERAEKSELIGEIRAIQRISKRPQSSKEELVRNTVEMLKKMLIQLEAGLD